MGAQQSQMHLQGIQTDRSPSWSFACDACYLEETGLGYEDPRPTVPTPKLASQRKSHEHSEPDLHVASLEVIWPESEQRSPAFPAPPSPQSMLLEELEWSMQEPRSPRPRSPYRGGVLSLFT
eukprot:CAMPEP_0197631484 /NCGR_PEP_ID=MMETSP1338-20131121/8628_1 /TAXON_ID=43686 ORGANISM="Pelagodinium beii, Strain RCC1491" /NCGR_SAMPLE_ID=MMETSP1338 /ASSEMBLY_ACC=CAM_ASM_000754 /LENGTH=121 /DNA_ID=CAMNT_0043202937 /DNA_START=60 /DNA_END=421 /DNA_ORIENTATION=+